MPIINGHLAFKYITDKELTFREFTQSVALALCAKVEGDEGRRLWWRHAAHGSLPWIRWWLALFLVTYPSPR